MLRRPRRPGPVLVLLLALLLPPALAPATAAGAGPDSLRVALSPDSLPLAPTPDSTRYAELRARREYQYREPEPVQLSLWDRFWRAFWRWLGRALDQPATGWVLRVLFYGFIGGVLVWVVLQVLRIRITGALEGPGTRVDYSTEAAETPFSDQLLERLLAAEAEADYRLATRLGYLLVLGHLAARELVRWQPDKTNLHYYRELAPGPVRDLFGPLTRQFEVAWYGERRLDAADYAAVQTTRDNLLRALGVPHLAPVPGAQPAPAR